MSTWKTDTKNSVRFEPLANGAWENFQLDIKAIGCVTIEDDPKIKGRGKATVGYHGGRDAFVKLEPNLTGDYLKRTPLHELGHTLGLEHEHQRFDRDNWVTIPAADINSDPVNYAKIPKTISVTRWQYISVLVGLWTIRVPYLVFWEEDAVFYSSTFDFSSIMLYSGLTIKKTNGTILSTATTVPLNTKLSSLDISQIRNLYWF